MGDAVGLAVQRGVGDLLRSRAYRDAIRNTPGDVLKAAGDALLHILDVERDRITLLRSLVCDHQILVGLAGWVNVEALTGRRERFERALDIAGLPELFRGELTDEQTALVRP